MNEIEIDKEYIDEIFINRLNSLDDEKFNYIINYTLENYQIDSNHEQIAYFCKIIATLFGNEIDSLHFLRQIKYLVNKGSYNRLTKKFKNDLLLLNMNENKIDNLIEIQKNYFEKINEINKRENSDNYLVEDFSVKTLMPVHTTNYNLKNNDKNILNEDLKKQNILIKLDIKDHESLQIQMDKTKLINFYEEMEKIQEKLDKLY